MLHPIRLCLYLMAVLFSIVGAVPSFVPAAAHAVPVPDFPQDLEIRKELFPGYRKWSTLNCLLTKKLNKVETNNIYCSTSESK